MSVQRFLLILAVLCVVGTALVFPATASAHTNTQLSQQQQSVANDLPGYRFDAGAWGYGYCFNHKSAVQFESNSEQAKAIVEGAFGAFFGPAGFTATLALESQTWYIKKVDRGNGFCVAWVFGSPYLPAIWGRK